MILPTRVRISAPEAPESFTDDPMAMALRPSRAGWHVELEALDTDRLEIRRYELLAVHMSSPPEVVPRIGTISIGGLTLEDREHLARLRDEISLLLDGAADGG